MIGILDSGVGGMILARTIEMSLRAYPLLYLGDTAGGPYGSKSSEKIVRSAIKNTSLLIDNGARLILIACHCIASLATQTLRQQFSIPIVEVITPAVTEAARISRRGRIGIIGTPATINSGFYEKLLLEGDDSFKVFSKACPLLVPLVEEGWQNRRETKMILRRYLHSLRNHQLDSLILGCGHYGMIKNLIASRIGKKVQLVDPVEVTAVFLGNYLKEQGIILAGSHPPEQNRYYFTDITDSGQKIVDRIFDRHIDLRQI
jgi:glutamate racemase